MNTLPPTDYFVVQSYSSVTPYITKDGSEIRELIHPQVHRNAAQSLAEATCCPDSEPNATSTKRPKRFITSLLAWAS